MIEGIIEYFANLSVVKRGGRLVGVYSRRTANFEVFELSKKLKNICLVRFRTVLCNLSYGKSLLV